MLPYWTHLSIILHWYQHSNNFIIILLCWQKLTSSLNYELNISMLHYACQATEYVTHIKQICPVLVEIHVIRSRLFDGKMFSSLRGGRYITYIIIVNWSPAVQVSARGRGCWKCTPTTEPWPYSRATEGL